ncbi:MAG: AAA family ATPase [Chloroflexi bacterium]|nr:AAA family ATPase [Chloroflexota bacterium]
MRRGAPSPPKRCGVLTLRRQIEAAAERYRGPFLAGVSLPDAPDFEAWLEGQRAHWRGVDAELLDRLATLQLLDADSGAAIATLERWTSVNPDEEGAWRRLIELHLRREDSAGARRAWQAYRATLAELDVETSPDMVALAARIEGATTSNSYLGSGSSAPWDDLAFRTMPLVGREREWSALFAAYERSQAGRTEVVVLEGETGIGKSRLLSQFLTLVRRTGADVVVGRAFEKTVGELPYAPLVEALRGRLEEENAPDDLLSDLWLGELSRLVPELRERYPDLPASADDPTLGRGRLFEAVARLGQALAEPKPLVFCLDDLQWTDVATLDLVRYAVRRWAERRTPVLVILSGRSENLRADRELGRWLGRLERDTPTVRMELKALEPRDVVRLAGSPHDPDSADRTGGRRGSDSDATRAGVVVIFGEWLARRTGGRPLGLVQALHALLEEGALRVRDAGDSGWRIAIPDMIEAKHDQLLDDLLVSRLRAHNSRRLSHPSEAEADRLAAAGLPRGQSTDQRVTEAASGDEGTGPRALDVLVRELLRGTGESGNHDVTHDLAREAAVGEAGRARRRACRRRGLNHHPAWRPEPLRQGLAG